jgi:hypothetical protein
MTPRFSRISLSLAALLVASIAAADYTPYHELRQDHPSIDAAVAALPSSDINGTFNRISALLERGSVRDLAFGQSDQLPANFESGMSAALQDLRVDVSEGFPTLTLEQRLTLMQVIDVSVMHRITDLYGIAQTGTCNPTPEHPCPISLHPPVVGQLDSLAGALRAEMVAMIQVYNDDPASTVNEPNPGSVQAQSFDAALDRVRATFLTIKGVESIDD